MWIVRLALRRPYTFVVMALLIVLFGGVTISRMPTDIFPEVDIPVVAIVWNYGGLPPKEMEQRIVSQYERALTTTVNDIEHIESQSLTGVAVIKVFFHPGAKIEAATAQITAISQPVIRQMPPGTTPPLIIRYSASNVPIMQAALFSDTLTEQQLFDYGANSLRGALATVQGAQIPWPYGGKNRQIIVDLDPERMFARGLSPSDVTAAVNAQNLILPSGTVKIENLEYPVHLNSSPDVVQALNDLPIKTVDGKTLFVRDVATVRDGYAPQTSIVHANGRRGALLPINKASNASTLDIVSRVRAALPGVLRTLPKELEVRLMFDQSVFVRAAVQGVLHEGALAAGLTGLMIFLFLGSWRSTVVIMVSIPLSILVAIIVLAALGQTLNVMTLGGMALAVGILVDDATVEIENIHRNLGQRKPLVRAILDGAQQIAVPAFVSTLCICIVFVPIAFISGPARSLFVPLGMSVVFAMLTSYLLSRTLVPTLVRYLLAAEVAAHASPSSRRGLVARLHGRLDAAFLRLRDRYGLALAWALAHRGVTVAAMLLLVLSSVSLLPLIGRDFFPQVDAGLIRLHARARPSLRIEETERLFARIQSSIRDVIPAAQIDTMLDNIGLPVSGINLALGDPSMISSADGEILISLKKPHDATAGHVRRLRTELARQYPDVTFFFLAPDIVTQVLNFGLSAPLDVQIAGPNANLAKNLELARQLTRKIAAIPGAVDVHLAQVPEAPQLKINVDRTMASEMGATQRGVASDVLVSLSSSGVVSPGFWLDPKMGVQYVVAVQTPQHKIDSLQGIFGTPVATDTARPRLLADVAGISRILGATNITHHNVAQTFDVLANVDGADLGSVTSAVEKLIAETERTLPRGTTIRLRGQAESMNSSFRGLALGLVFAVLLVYLLMVVNFQSWIDPLIILMALPGAVVGIVWMLFLSATTVSVPALMGAIMCVGVATANSILVITFANEQRAHGLDAHDAALAAGMTRLRPVLMTGMAMMLGMLPMAFGLGEGSEQNVPLGRAVIGGLLMATVATLFFVPVVYSLLRRQPPPALDPELEEPLEVASHV